MWLFIVSFQQFLCNLYDWSPLKQVCTDTHWHTHWITIFLGIVEFKRTRCIKVKVPLCNNCDITFYQKALDNLMHILSTSLNKIFKTECYCQLHTFILSTLLQSEDFYKVYLSRNSYPLIGRPGHLRVAATHHPLLPLLPVSPSHQSLWRLGISVTPGNNGQSHGITRCFQAETCSLEVSPPICKLTVNSV